MKSFHSLNMTKRRKKHIGVFIQSSVSRIPRLPDLPLLPVQLERLRAPRLSFRVHHMPLMPVIFLLGGRLSN